MALQKQILNFKEGSFDHYYLCQYRPWHAGFDDLSRSLIHFKQGRQLHVTAWTECAATALRDSNFEGDFLVIRILGSNEISITRSSNTPLDTLAKKVALALDSVYLPECLKKKRVTNKVSTLSAVERIEALKDVFTFKPAEQIDELNKILIVDDILTTGTTISIVISTILKEVQDIHIKVFTLAATDHQAMLNEKLKLEGLQYKWEVPEGWTMIEEGEPSYQMIAQLKRRIPSDWDKIN